MSDHMQRIMSWNCNFKRCPEFGSYLEIEKKVKEERAARERAENRIVQIEKQCSMLDFDLKQSHQKLEHLCEQKERLEDEVTFYIFILHWILKRSWHFLNLKKIPYFWV